MDGPAAGDEGKAYPLVRNFVKKAPVRLNGKRGYVLG